MSRQGSAKNYGHIRTTIGCLGRETLVSIAPQLEWGRFCSKASFPENGDKPWVMETSWKDGYVPDLGGCSPLAHLFELNVQCGFDDCWVLERHWEGPCTKVFRTFWLGLLNWAHHVQILLNTTHFPLMLFLQLFRPGSNVCCWIRLNSDLGLTKCL